MNGANANIGLTKASWNALKEQTATMRDAVINEKTIMDSDEYKKLDQKLITDNMVKNNIAIDNATNYVQAIEAASGQKIGELSKYQIAAYKARLSSRQGGSAKSQMETMEKDMGKVQTAIDDVSNVRVIEAVEERSSLMKAIGTEVGQTKFSRIVNNAKYKWKKKLMGMTDAQIEAEGKRGGIDLDEASQSAVTAYLADAGDSTKLEAAAKLIAKSSGMSEADVITNLQTMAKDKNIVARAQKVESNIGATLLAKGVANIQQPLQAAGLKDLGTALAENNLDTKAFMAADREKLKSFDPKLEQAQSAMQKLGQASSEAASKNATVTKEQLTTIVAESGLTAVQQKTILEQVKTGTPEEIKRAQAIMQSAALQTREQAGGTSMQAGQGAAKAGTPDELFSKAYTNAYDTAKILETLAKKLQMT
jgi:hypothetical protein